MQTLGRATRLEMKQALVVMTLEVPKTRTTGSRAWRWELVLLELPL